jgi:hypothetical protein
VDVQHFGHLAACEEGGCWFGHDTYMRTLYDERKHSVSRVNSILILRGWAGWPSC